MADEKNVGAVSRVAISRYLCRNKVVNEAVKSRNHFCELGFHEIFAAFCVNVLHFTNHAATPAQSYGAIERQRARRCLMSDFQVPLKVTLIDGTRA
jgi:hypothetical protein